MDVDELKALARAVEPLTAVTGGLHGGAQVVAYNDLVSRFRERITRALNKLTLGLEVEPELTRELWLMAKALPGVRSRVEASAQGERPGSGE